MPTGEKNKSGSKTRTPRRLSSVEVSRHSMRNLEKLRNPKRKPVSPAEWERRLQENKKRAAANKKALESAKIAAATPRADNRFRNMHVKDLSAKHNRLAQLSEKEIAHIDPDFNFVQGLEEDAALKLKRVVDEILTLRQSIFYNLSSNPLTGEAQKACSAASKALVQTQKEYSHALQKRNKVLAGHSVSPGGGSSGSVATNNDEKAKQLDEMHELICKSRKRQTESLVTKFAGYMEGECKQDSSFEARFWTAVGNSPDSNANRHQRFSAMSNDEVSSEVPPRTKFLFSTTPEAPLLF